MKSKRSGVLPEYFNEIARTIEVDKNLRISIVGRQALISLKLYAATPSYSKHTTDISRLEPNVTEITEAVRFVLSFDNTGVRKDELRFILKKIGFDGYISNEDFCSLPINQKLEEDIAYIKSLVEG